MERSETALFLFECDNRRDPWEQGTSCLCEGFRRGALPHGSGGREDDGEPEKTTEPWGLQLVGMGILGDRDGTTLDEEQGEHPLGTSTQWETSSSESSEDESEEESVSFNTKRIMHEMS